MSIEIELKLFVTLSEYLPENSDKYKVPEKMTVETLIHSLEIPMEIVKLIFVNGKREDLSYQLQHEDRIGLFPPVGGG